MREPLIIKKFYRFKARHAQITTFFIIMLGILLFLMTILIDLNQVAVKKTSMAMGVDSAATYLGSILTSHAKSLSDQAAKGKAYHKESGGFWSGWAGEILGIVVIIVLIVFSIVVAYLQQWYMTWWGMLIIGAIIGAMSWGLSEIWRRQAIMEAFSDYLQLLNDPKDTYRESMLFSVIAGIANDPVKVVDIHDINRNGNTKEWISRFMNHYEERLRLLVIAQGGGEGGEESLEVLVSRILTVSEAVIYGSDSMLDLRKFAKGGLWELFSNIHTPGYDALGLSLAIEAAEAEDYDVQERVEELADDLLLGYGVDSDIWDKDHPHAEVNDNFPLPPWDDTTLCQVSLAIYAIHYTGKGGFASLKASVDELLSLSVSDIVDSITSGSGEIFLSEIDELCESLGYIESGLNGWKNHLELKQTPINDDVRVLGDEIILLNKAIGDLAPEAPELDAYNNLLLALEEVEDYLGELVYKGGKSVEVGIETAKSSLGTYISKASSRRLALESLVSAIRNYESPIADKVGEAVYAWEDTRGWHMVKAYVGSELIVPHIRTHRKKDWDETTVEIFIEPYDSGGQKILIQALRFDEPISTPWWNFYPSGRYSEAEWEALTTNFEKRFTDGGGFIVKGDSLYPDVDKFIEDYGLETEAKSSTAWANRVGEESRWSIGIKDPK